jgi:hypothetical protein
MNARYESRDNNIARAQLSEYHRAHVVKYGRAFNARALCEGACYCDYIFRVRDTVVTVRPRFYDVRETLCPAVRRCRRLR